MSQQSEEVGPEFVEDGHRLRFYLEKDNIRIIEIHCPNEGTQSLCNRRRNYCAVNRFLNVYGIEANLGRALIDGDMEIAWAAVLGASDIDAEFSQVWVIPVTDPDYVSWKEERDQDGSGGDL